MTHTEDTAASETTAAVFAVARAAKDAQPALAALTRASKDALLHAMADALVADTDAILAGNALDLERADEAGIEAGLRDRLLLDPERVGVIADQLRQAASLPDPVGEVVRGSVLANGLQLTQVRVPLGVVGMIYEARPNVTVDAAGLALKSGNAVVLRGGSAALESNRAIIASMHGALTSRGLPAALIGGIDDYGREGAGALMQARGLVDVLIPRGGAGLIQRVLRESLVPVIETGTGNTHVFVDASANLTQAVDIVINAKTQRIGVCNALENLLVHEDIAPTFLPLVAAALGERGVSLHADAPSAEHLEGHGAPIIAATPEDFDTEYLALELAVAVVPDVHAAIAHIRAHSSGHTESILTQSIASEQAFVQGVDSAVVMVNASTRFSDGGEFGFGAEIGISTQKLHARGPMALTELTSTKWIVRGNGHVRP
ncbi:MAG: glutamate-5-semialdehyde dehydrogenase [Dermabacter sp.]|nr:glutamate-5-semialdehyde dehydrogenase [Dermabacter sp.]